MHPSARRPAPALQCCITTARGLRSAGPLYGLRMAVGGRLTLITCSSMERCTIQSPVSRGKCQHSLPTEPGLLTAHRDSRHSTVAGSMLTWHGVSALMAWRALMAWMALRVSTASMACQSSRTMPAAQGAPKRCHVTVEARKQGTRAVTASNIQRQSCTTQLLSNCQIVMSLPMQRQSHQTTDPWPSRHWRRWASTAT